jgi:hypothetical protein
MDALRANRTAFRRSGFWIAVLAIFSLLGPEAVACFGTRLRIGVSQDESQALASYGAGYYVEEKTGVAPQFVEVEGDPEMALRKGEIDVLVVRSEVPAPEGLSLRDAGEIPGLGPSRFWLRPEVLDDLRFFTVDRALKSIPRFYGSDAYREARGSGRAPQKAARGAVLRAQ